MLFAQRAEGAGGLLRKTSENFLKSGGISRWAVARNDERHLRVSNHFVTQQAAM
jgi:hypothetical protein